MRFGSSAKKGTGEWVFLVALKAVWWVRGIFFSSFFRRIVGICEWVFLVCVTFGRFFFCVFVGVFSGVFVRFLDGFSLYRGRF